MYGGCLFLSINEVNKHFCKSITYFPSWQEMTMKFLQKLCLFKNVM